MRIALLPTGKAELLGLPTALGRLFPGHEFWSIAAVEPDLPFDGFTSSRLPAPEEGVPTNLTRLVQEATSVVCAGDVDLVLVLDDLELENGDQPRVVVNAVREAARRHLDELARIRPTLAPRAKVALRERVSFHLAVPMLEAWFFADPAGARRAGVPVERLPPKLVANWDPEAFLTDDPDFVADDGSGCTTWRTLPPPKRDSKRYKPGWLKRGPDRVRHPKDYLAWLSRDAAEKDCCAYRETHEGRVALEGLDWRAVLQAADQVRFLRAMIEDIADALGVPSPVAPGNVAPETARSALPPDPMLRNL